MGVSARTETQPEIVFYDGACGLCHRTVRFILKRDRYGRLFRFAPLRSRVFHTLVPAAQRELLPDSVVVRRPDGTLLSQSSAVLHILRRLGGPWRWLAGVGCLVPRWLRDGLYVALARLRRRVSPPPEGACPVGPRSEEHTSELQSRTT
jgi:predicted DCC family thiol-disulfide oxidoreductase YuxK